MDNTEIFARKLREFDSLIKYASRRFKINGILDQDDLYQEGLVILNGMFDKYDHHPDSTDFRKLFKTELWHGLSKCFRFYCAKKRNFKVQVNEGKKVSSSVKSKGKSKLETSDTEAEDSSIDGLFESTFSTRSDELLMLNEQVLEAEEFVSLLTQRLDEEAQTVLKELLNPRDWDDIPEEFKVTRNDEVYWREPTVIPQQVVAKMLGFSLSRVRKVIRRIRRTAAELDAELGMNLTRGMELQERS